MEPVHSNRSDEEANAAFERGRASFYRGEYPHPNDPDEREGWEWACATEGDL